MSYFPAKDLWNFGLKDHVSLFAGADRRILDWSDHLQDVLLRKTNAPYWGIPGKKEPPGGAGRSRAAEEGNGGKST